MVTFVGAGIDRLGRGGLAAGIVAAPTARWPV